MFGWIKDSVLSITGWLGEGVGAFFEWLLGGLGTIISAFIDAVGSFGRVLDALWDLACSIMNALLGLFVVFFPFVPAPVMSVISMGFMAILIAAVIKKWRKE